MHVHWPQSKVAILWNENQFIIIYMLCFGDSSVTESLQC